MTSAGRGRAPISGRGLFGLLLLAFLLGVALLTPLLSPHDPFESSFTQSRLPPAWVKSGVESGQDEFPLGTDRFGRDVLSRLIHGTRTSVALALASVTLVAVIGTLAGLAAGYLGGAADALLSYLFDTVQAVPGIMFMVMVILILRDKLAPTWSNGVLTLVVGFATVGWVGLARVIRVTTQQLKVREFVEAARSLGGSPWHILTRHLLPNVAHLIVVWIIANIPAVILMEALLGYVGIGVTRGVDGDEFGVISWGGLIFSGRPLLNFNPTLVLGPTLGILLMTLGVILLADHLEARYRRADEG
ncbi:MAG: ABC transporter permease [Thermoflexales bacterium]|nr:ABC transporter permease [Thermoflexales bacterium]